jgi:hypothetical protein
MWSNFKVDVRGKFGPYFSFLGRSGIDRVTYRTGFSIKFIDLMSGFSPPSSIGKMVLLTPFKPDNLRTKVLRKGKDCFIVEMGANFLIFGQITLKKNLGTGLG